jgi:hypothetical protein
MPHAITQVEGKSSMAVERILQRSTMPLQAQAAAYFTLS